MRVLAFDAGETLGWAALGDDGSHVVSGSIRLNGGPRAMGRTGVHCNRVIPALIDEQGADVVAFASPYVKLIHKKVQTKRGMRTIPLPINPDAIRPLFGVLTLIETICEGRGIRCVEVDEPEARRAFLTGVPRKSRDIDHAMAWGCKIRNWPAATDHARDALCIASFVLECTNKKIAYKQTPLFVHGSE